ncbi:MAG: hypothetical protein EXQ55_03565 [Acidobacteria bacterium]|nr:hypothetical protein [Acidobacteriota bacterium]
MIASAFLHHDFACHEHPLAHCNACSAAQSAKKSEAGGAPVTALDSLVGRIEIRMARAVYTPALSCVSDRAPPA